MKLNFTSLEYFRKAAKMEHLTKAAEALHIAQPALSRTIRGLEEELGVTLFEREGRNIHLTRDGHILLKHAENFLQEYDEMQQEFADSKNLQQMTVNLAIHSATKLIPSFLAEFRKDHPEAMLEIINPKMEAAPKHTDLTLYSSIHHVENEHTVTLFRENLVMVLPLSDRHARLPYINLADFADRNYIAPPKGFVLRDILETYCGKAGFSPKIVMESDNPDTIHEFVNAGLGIALVPQMTWYNAYSGLASLPVGDMDCHRYLNLSWKTEKAVPLRRAPQGIHYRPFLGIRERKGKQRISHVNGRAFGVRVQRGRLTALRAEGCGRLPSAGCVSLRSGGRKKGS